MREAWEIGLNTLRIALKSRQTLIIALVMPIGFTWIMGQFMGGGRSISEEPVRLPVQYVDADRSDLSRRLVALLGEDGRLTLTEAADRATATEAVLAGKLAGAVIVPQGFAAAVRGGGPQIAVDVVAITGDARAAALRSAVAMVNVRLAANAGAAEAVVQGLKSAGRNPVDADWDKAFTAADALWQQAPPIAMRAETATGGQVFDLTGNMHVSMGFLLAFLAFTVAFSAGSILEERQSGTWGRLLTTPTSRRSIVGGKLIGTLLLGLGQIVLMVVFGQLVMGVPWGRSPLGATLVLGGFLWATVGIGVMLAGFVKSSAQLGAVVPIVMSSTAMLGGCYWPLEIVPRPMQIVGYITPHAWAMQGLTDLMARHQPVSAVLVPVLVLFAFGAVGFGVGISRVRYE